MSKVTELKAGVIDYQAAEITATALQDISAIRVAAIRLGFEKNRAFFEEIRKLYAILQSQAKKANLQLAVQMQEEKKSKPKKVRQLYIALTSNKRFYGALMRDIIAALAKEIEKSPDASAVIVGRVGWQYFEEMSGSKRARQLILESDTPTAAELKSLISLFESFDQIFVFYPKFINPFRQDVGLEDITQSIASQGAANETADDAGYIFEPEIPALLAFFDTQVRRVLFDRVLLEAELSRTSARLIKMGESAERAKHLVAVGQGRVRREMAALSNMELLETFAGFTQWHRV